MKLKAHSCATSLSDVASVMITSLVRGLLSQSRELPTALSAILSPTAGTCADLARTLCLNWRTGYRAVGAEYAAVTLLRSQHRAAAGALVENLAGVGRHGFHLSGGAMRAGNNRLKEHVDFLEHVTYVRGTGRVGEHGRF